MNEILAIFLDSGYFEGVFRGIAVGVGGGACVALLVRYLNRKDREEEAEKAILQTQLNGFGLKLESECESRRAKDDVLGSEISDTRGALDHVCGKIGQPRPSYRERT